MKSGLLLPPMIFDVNELEALILGLRWVQSNADDELKASAARAANKINAVVKNESRAAFSDSTLFVPASQLTQVDNNIAGDLRRSLREELKIKLHYQDKEEQTSHRLIWPVAIGYMKEVQVLAAWCELRQSYRHFRLDRIKSCEVLTDKLPYPKKYLLDRWRKEVLCIPPDRF